MRSSGCRRSQIPRAQRIDLVVSCLLVENLLKCRKSLRLRDRQVIRLGKVARQVVEFPGVLVRIPLREARMPGQPRDQRAKRTRIPTILVNAAAAVVVEVLGLLSPGPCASANV